MAPNLSAAWAVVITPSLRASTTCCVSAGVYLPSAGIAAIAGSVIGGTVVVVAGAGSGSGGLTPVNGGRILEAGGV